MTKAQEIRTVIRIRAGNGDDGTLVYMRWGGVSYENNANRVAMQAIIDRYPIVGVFYPWTPAEEIEAKLGMLAHRRAA